MGLSRFLTTAFILKISPLFENQERLFPEITAILDLATGHGSPCLTTQSEPRPFEAPGQPVIPPWLLAVWHHGGGGLGVSPALFLKAHGSYPPCLHLLSSALWCLGISELLETRRWHPSRCVMAASMWQIHSRPAVGHNCP